MYSENFGFGLGGFIINRTFNNRMKGLCIHIHVYVHIILYAHIFSCRHVDTAKQ